MDTDQRMYVIMGTLDQRKHGYRSENVGNHGYCQRKHGYRLETIGYCGYRLENAWVQIREWVQIKAWI